MIIYHRELGVDGMHLNTMFQFTDEWTRQAERFSELEEELRRLRDKAKLAGVPPMGLGGLI